MANNYILDDISEFQGNDGDIINTKYIWWNGCAHQLQNEPDQYGTIPQCVKITDSNNITPYHWVNILTNSFVWFSDEIISRIQLDENNESVVSIHGTDYTFKYIDIFSTPPIFNRCAFWTQDNDGKIYFSILTQLK